MRYLDKTEVKKRYELLFEMGNDGYNLGELFEELITHIYNIVIKEGDIAIDCGANAGRHTIPMANLVRPTGCVYAVEPLTDIVRKLRKRIDMSGNSEIVKIIEAAVSDQVGTDNFIRVLDDAGYSGLKQRDYPKYFSQGQVTIQVEKVRIDDFCTEPQRVSFMKLDLEGGEFRALQGGVKVLSEGRSVIVFENARNRAAYYYDYTKEEFFNYFGHVNYDIYDILGTHFSPELWTWDDVPFSWYLIGIPSEKKGMLERISHALDQEVNSKLPNIFSI